MNRFGHAPLDKMVVGKYTCNRCRTKEFLAICRNEPLPAGLNPSGVYYVSPDVLLGIFTELLLTDALDEISVLKFNPHDARYNGWSGLHLSFYENCACSAFYFKGRISALMFRTICYT